MNKLFIAVLCLSMPLAAQVQLGKGVQVGGSGSGGGATLPATPSIVKSVTTTSSTPAVASDVVGLFTASPFNANQTNSVFNSDLNGGFSALVGTCIGTTPCVIAKPNGSADASDPFNSINAANPVSFFAHDYNTGLDFYQNANAHSIVSNPSGFGCFYGSTGTAPTTSYAGDALTNCQFVNASKTGGGVNANNQWTKFGLHAGNAYFMTRGQAFVDNINYIFGKSGDAIIRESNSTYRTAATDFNAEGMKWTAEHLQDGGVTFGTVSTPLTHSPGNDSVTLFLNGGGGARGIMDGGYLMYTAETIDTTTITAVSVDGTGANLVTTSSAHPVSTWQAMVTSPCGFTTVRDAKLAATCTVNVTVATSNPTSSSVVSVVDELVGGMYETTNLTGTLPTGTGTKTITIFLSAPVNTGAKLMIGGTAGGVGTFANGLANPTTNPATIQAWAVGGSPDAFHEYIVTNYKQQQQGIIPVALPPVISSPIFNNPQCTNASTGAMALPPSSFSGSSLAFNITLVGSMTYNIVGAASGINGNFTDLHVNQDGSATWTNPGGTCTAGFYATGGTISVQGNQGFVEYCGAEVTGITNAPWQSGPFFLGSGNVSVHTDPSSCTGAASEAVYQPDRVEQEVQMYTSLVTNSQKGAGNSKQVLLDTAGMGFSGVPVIEHTTENNQDPVHGDYFGHGGQNVGQPYLQEDAPNDGLYHSAFAPLNGRPVMTIGCPFEGCSSTQADTPVVQITGFASPFAGNIVWRGSVSHWSMGSTPVEFGSHGQLQLGFWPTNSSYQALTFNGAMDATQLGFVGALGDNILYHQIPSGGAETWRFGTLATGINVGNLTATNFDYPGFSEAGNPVCTAANGLCGSGGGGLSLTPSGSQLIQQPSTSTFAAINDNWTIKVAAAPSSCSGTGYNGTHTRSTDCAWGYAFHQTGTTGNPVLIDFGYGNGTYTTCDGLIEPTTGFGMINIRGAGSNATFIRADTTAGCATANGGAVFSKTTDTTAIAISGVTFDGNNVSNQVFHLDATFNPVLHDIEYQHGNPGLGLFTADVSGTAMANVTNTSGLALAVGDWVLPIGVTPQPPVQVTAITGTSATLSAALPTITGGSFQSTLVDSMVSIGSTGTFAENSGIDHIGTQTPVATTVNDANLTANMTGSAVTSVTIVNGGLYGGGQQYMTLFFNDPNHVCDLLPIGNVTVTSNVITAVTITSGGSCPRGTPYVLAYPQVPYPYGFSFLTSDSLLTDVYPGVGIIGMKAFGGNTTYVHIHPTDIQVGVEDHGGTIYVGSEMDQMGTHGFMFTNPSLSSTVIGTTGVTLNHHRPGFSTYHFSNAAAPVSFNASGGLWTSNPPIGYVEYTNAAGAVIPCGTGWPALALTIGDDKSAAGGKDCLPDLAISGQLKLTALTSQGLLGTDANGIIVAGTPGTATARVASGFCSGAESTSITPSLMGFGLSTSGCNSARSASLGMVMVGSGLISNPRINCGIAGLNSTSGTFTIFDRPSGGSETSTGVTATFGTAAVNTTVTGTGTFSYAAGDKITVAGTTQTGETVGSCNLSFNY